MRLAARLPLVAALALASPPVLAQTQRPAAQGHEVRLELRAPTRATVTPAGELLVSDYSLKRVCTVVPGSRFVAKSFAVNGHPTALGVHGTRVFVGNEDLQRVQIHAPDGQLLGTLGGSGFTVEDPRDLAVDAQQERLYVVDGLAREVKVFDLSTSEGTLVATIGVGGATVSTFQNPTGIALDLLTQEVFVSDFGALGPGQDARVLIFGFDGTWHGAIQGDGGPTGQYFGRPQGLVIGSSGNLFVVDSWRGEVVVMERATGTQVATLGTYGKQPGELFLPLDAVVLGPDEDLVVTSCRSRRIETFAQGGKL